jgi:hypothetical protein
LKARTYLSAGTILLRSGNLDEARRLYAEAIQVCLITNNQHVAFLISLNLAMISSLEGDKGNCLRILELESKRAISIRLFSPVGYFTYLNTLAVEKSEIGCVEEALSLIEKPLASPLASYYPEWLETQREATWRGYRRSRSVISVKRIKVQDNIVNLPISEKAISQVPVDEPAKLLIFTGRGQMPDQVKDKKPVDVTQRRREIVDFLYKHGEEIGADKLDTFFESLKKAIPKREEKSENQTDS